MQCLDRGFRRFVARGLLLLASCYLVVYSGNVRAEGQYFINADGSPWQEGSDVQFDSDVQLPSSAPSCSTGGYTAKQSTTVLIPITEPPPAYCYGLSDPNDPVPPAGCLQYWNGGPPNSPTSYSTNTSNQPSTQISTISGNRCTVATTCGKQVTEMNVGYTQGGALCSAFCNFQQKLCSDDLRASGIGQIQQSLQPKLDYSDQSPCGRFSRLDQICTASCAQSAQKRAPGFDADQCAADCTRLHAETEQVCKPKDKAAINPVPSSVVVGTGLVQPEQKPSEPMGKPGDHPIVGGKATSALIAPCASFKRVEAMCTSFCEQAPAEDRKKCTQDCQALGANSDVIRACGGREAGSIVKDKRAKMNSQGVSKSTGVSGQGDGKPAPGKNGSSSSSSVRSGGDLSDRIRSDDRDSRGRVNSGFSESAGSRLEGGGVNSSQMDRRSGSSLDRENRSSTIRSDSDRRGGSVLEKEQMAPMRTEQPKLR